MSLQAVADIVADPVIQNRVIASAAVKGIRNPVGWESENRWQLAATSGWAGAYAEHGGAGITDEMIGAAVDAQMTNPTEPVI